MSADSPSLDELDDLDDLDLAILRAEAELERGKHTNRRILTGIVASVVAVLGIGLAVMVYESGSGTAHPSSATSSSASSPAAGAQQMDSTGRYNCAAVREQVRNYELLVGTGKMDSFGYVYWRKQHTQVLIDCGA